MNITKIQIPNAPKAVLLGGQMHRFPTDKSIVSYCVERNMDRVSIGSRGEVFVEKNDAYEGPYTEQIGWIG